MKRGSQLENTMVLNYNLSRIDNLVKTMITYKFAIDEITTQINILYEEFKIAHLYNSIESISSRVKSPESIIQKAKRKNYEFTIESIKENIRDIAGVRVT